MLFNSYTFVFVFLPVSIFVFFLLSRFLNKHVARIWLVLCSLYFYLAWDPGYWWVLLSTLGLNYSIGLYLLDTDKMHRKHLLTAGILANVIFLLWFKIKISPLFSNLSAAGDISPIVFSNTSDIYIPLAISFITFQQIVFLVDCYKNRLTSKHLTDYTLFISFFPQLVMGPIVHHREIVPQFRKPSIYRFNVTNFGIGLSIFIVGLFKKTVLSDGISANVNFVYSSAAMGASISTIDAWVGSFGFMFQLYFDFSGYADMAIGIARMLNINLPINFDTPLTARSRFEFWRRWHITFSEFMKNHVYMPLVRSKRIPLGRYTALIATTFLSGLWHGISLSFILWGFIQGLLMVMSNLVKRKLHVEHTFLKSTAFTVISVCMTLITTVFLGVLFKSGELTTATNIYKGMIGMNSHIITQDLTGRVPSLSTGRLLTEESDIYWIAVYLVIIFCLPTTRKYFAKHWTALDQRAYKKNATPTARLNWLQFDFNLVSSSIIFMMLLASLYAMLETSRFIYFQF